MKVLNLRNGEDIEVLLENCESGPEIIMTSEILNLIIKDYLMTRIGEIKARSEIKGE